MILLYIIYIYFKLYVYNFYIYIINIYIYVFDARTYVDVSAKYAATENLMVTFSINNLFDDEPGYTSDAGTAPGNGNTFPGYFDAFGQYIFLNLTLQY